jgi:3'-phosphoadenosine 5'-phosphosulfate sulfotransferase (PAPS reductase)/FAD synthetase
MPWSAAATRFCTSELKTAVACRALGGRFPGASILSVSGIRRAESAARSKTAICAPQPRLLRKRAGTSGWDWHPIIDWSHAAVFAFLRERNQHLHEAYTRYGCSRVSCAFCVLSSASDLAAASRCEGNHRVYLQLVELEAESSFSFQPHRWLGDVAPQLPDQPSLATFGKRKKDCLERDFGNANSGRPAPPGWSAASASNTKRGRTTRVHTA